MNTQRFMLMVNNLLMDLIECWQRKTPEVLIAGAAYMVTMKHWKEVKSECWQRPFPSEEDEISFFKKIKYQFTGRLAYYSILYEALAAAPVNKQEQQDFWKSELTRYDAFYNKHSAFLEYLQKGNTHFDNQYFLRKNLKTPVPSHHALYDGDPEFCTSRDYLVSGWFAETQYRQFLQAKLDH